MVTNSHQQSPPVAATPSPDPRTAGVEEVLRRTRHLLTRTVEDLDAHLAPAAIRPVQPWLDQAAALLVLADNACTAQWYDRAIAYAGAAQALTATAEVTAGEYRWSAEHALQHLYTRILRGWILVDPHSEAGSFLAEADGTYRMACMAAEAGDAVAAQQAIVLADSLLRVVVNLLPVSSRPRPHLVT